MKISTLLKRVARRVAKGWCKHTHATDEFGCAVDSCGPKAARWCILGAFNRETRETQASCQAAFHYLYSALGNISNWNDKPGRTKAQVVKRLNTIAEKAKREGL